MGGMLSGKAGLLHVHIGTGAAMLQPLVDAVAMSDVPIAQFLPTHMERNPQLVAAGIRWMDVGGYADFTAGPQVLVISCIAFQLVVNEDSHWRSC